MSPVALLDTERGVVLAITFSPKGDLLATGNWDGDIKVWQVQSKCCVSKMQRGDLFDAASQLAFSPDGARLASTGGRYDAVYVWCPETGKKLAKIKKAEFFRHRPYIIPLVYSPDATLIAAATAENTVSIWDSQTSEQIACFTGHTQMVVALAFSACGRFIASGDHKGTLQQWDAKTAQPVGCPVEYAKYAVIPSYTPAGRLLAAAIEEDTVSVWDVVRNEKLGIFEHHGAIGGRCFLDGRHLAVAGSRNFSVWHQSSELVSTVSRHTPFTHSLAFSPDGQRLVAIEAGWQCALWDIKKRERHAVNFGKQKRSYAVCSTSTDNMRVLLADEQTLSVCNLDSHEIIATVDAPHAGISRGFFSVTGNLWACPIQSGNIYVWDSSGKESVLRGQTDYIESCAFSPDEKRLASVSRDQTARVWDVTSGKAIIALRLSPPLSTDSLPSTPELNANIYKGDADTIEAVLQGETPRYRHTAVQAITFSPCGNFLAAGMEGGIRLWDANTYETHMIILLPREYRRQFALAFSPCGRYMASGTWWCQTEKVPIYLWDVATGENIATFWGHPTDVQDLAFSPDGALLASGSFDGTILLWDMTPYLDHETL